MIQLGSLVTLYVSLVAMIFVLFGIINTLYPDVINGYYGYDSAQQNIRMGIAMLVVFFPAFVLCTRMVNQIRRNETGTYLILTKWLVYLSLLVGGSVLLGDFVTIILTYLNGEMTVRFILKALVLAGVIGIALYYYIMDARGYWNTHENHSKMYGVVVVFIALATLVGGFMYSDSPTKVREIQIDTQQISDLGDMQWRIEDHYRINQSLPTAIAELYIGMEVPKAETSRASYTYTIIDVDTYELCATFAYPSDPQTIDTPQRTEYDSAAKNPYNNWGHEAGKTCFERTLLNETLVPTSIEAKNI